MAKNDIPSEPPPSYSDVTGATSSSRPNASSDKDHLGVPGGKNAIPSSYRRSMEDEHRPLPEGWVRTFDPENEHQFFVDTTKDPPRSIWVHPYDDPTYLATLSSEERERIEQESLNQGHPPSKEDIIASHSDEDEDHDRVAPGELPPRPDGKGKGRDDRSFGRKWKDKITGTTHAEREVERKRRAEQEQKLYEQHLRLRQAMVEASRTGKPQLVGKDSDGKEIYVEPPGGYPGARGYGVGYGYEPHRGAVYNTPNARYIRPSHPYSRPMGYGYGGGYGLPLALGGGLAGGLLLGDALGGGFGGFGL